MANKVWKTKIPTRLTGKWEEHRGAEVKEMLEAQVSERPAPAPARRRVRPGHSGISLEGLENLRSCTSFLGNPFQYLAIVTANKVSHLQSEPLISIWALYADMNLLFNVSYHHTVCSPSTGEGAAALLSVPPALQNKSPTNN